MFSIFKSAATRRAEANLARRVREFEEDKQTLDALLAADPNLAAWVTHGDTYDMFTVTAPPNAFNLELRVQCRGQNVKRTVAIMQRFIAALGEVAQCQF